MFIRFFKLSLLISLFFCFMIFKTNADIDKIQVRDDFVTILGVSNKSNSDYLVTVFKPGFRGTALSDKDMEELTAYIGQGVADDNGAFLHTIKMNGNLPSGLYKVRVSCAGEPVTFWSQFNYLSQSDTKSVVEDFNNADVEQLKSLTEEYSIFMGIDMDGLYSELTEHVPVYQKMWTYKQNKPFVCLSNIADVFTQSVHLASFENIKQPDQALQFLKEHALILGVDFSIYDKLNDGIAAITPLIGKDYPYISSLVSVFDESIGTYAFANLSRSDMESLINEYSKYLTLPISYEKLTVEEKRLLYKQLEAASSFKDFESISLFITNFINDIRKDSNSVNTGAGSKTGNVKSSFAIQNDPIPVTAPVLSEPYFDDISDVDWAHKAIMYLAGRNVLSGDGNNRFMPHNNVTREEFVKMLIVSFDIPQISGTQRYVDVPINKWYYPYVEAAAHYGIVLGISEDCFGAGESISRQDIAVMLYRTALFKNIELDSRRNAANFDDQNEISDYAMEAVDKLYRSYIINGISEKQFDALSFSTRAMAAKAVYELLSYWESSVK